MQTDRIEKRQDRLERTASGMVLNSTSGGELSEQPSEEWTKFEGLFPMNTMEQFNEFEKALGDPHVCIV